MTTTNRIPAGLLDEGVEFFTVVEDGVRRVKALMGGMVMPFSRVPESKKDILRNALRDNPTKRKAMERIAGPCEDSALEQFVICNYGALNDDPDIDAHGNLSEPEYAPCPNRATCTHRGKGCDNLRVYGTQLSARQSDVFSLSVHDNKTIADILFISVETVKKHMQTIQDETGLSSKPQMVQYATSKGII
ncbi:response regulator transcription factor [Pedobacter faecalis]|uniref:response regulator transcription factor n=1 Tax=Pedobacter faecalis TaxID=3041495 RepID=UPI00254D1D6E|nr:helix-turn-helix transcriptional regulator [Pedobacter sp. ELA7]